MKKIRIVAGVLFCICMMIFCSCAGRPSKDAGVDSKSEADASNGSMSETETGSIDCNCSFLQLHTLAALNGDILYYFPGENVTNDAMLHYYDSAADNGGILCGKPECLHNSEECNAWLGNHVYGLSYYNGELYWLGNNYDWKNGTISTDLYNMRPDGTEHKAVRKICETGDDLELPLNNQRTAIHRGYVFCSGEVCPDMDAGELHYRTVITASPIDSDDNILLEDLEYEFGPLYQVRLYPYQEYLYYVICILLPTEDGYAPEVSVSVKRWNLDTGKTEAVYEGAQQLPDFALGEIWVTEDEIWLSDFMSSKVYTVDLSNCSFTTKKDYKDIAAIHGVKFTDSYMVLDEGINGNLVILDRETEREILRTDEIPSDYRSFAGADAKAVYYYMYTSGTTEHRYFLRVPIDGSKPEILWDE